MYTGFPCSNHKWLPVLFASLVVGCRLRGNDFKISCPEGNGVIGKRSKLSDYEDGGVSGKILRHPCKDVAYMVFMDDRSAARIDFHGVKSGSNVEHFLRANGISMDSGFSLGVKIDVIDSGKATEFRQVYFNDWRRFFSLDAR